jgi:hypothetical protein
MEQRNLEAGTLWNIGTLSGNYFTERFDKNLVCILKRSSGNNSGNEFRKEGPEVRETRNKAIAMTLARMRTAIPRQQQGAMEDCVRS